jgi:hypothetical protein
MVDTLYFKLQDANRVLKQLVSQLDATQKLAVDLQQQIRLKTLQRDQYLKLVGQNAERSSQTNLSQRSCDKLAEKSNV